MLARRELLIGAAGAAAFASPFREYGAWAAAAEPSGRGDRSALPPPIGPEERLHRIAKAQTLMRDAGLGAILVEAGSSLDYFTGIQWWRSERLTAAILPAEGEALVVTPFFEEPSVRETLQIPAEVRTWQEDGSPAALIADWLTARGLGDRPLGVEETVRYFAVDALSKAGIETGSDRGVVRACRIVKSPAEIALMQAANDLTVAAYREIWPQIEAGMTPADIGAVMAAAMKRRGGSPEFTLVLLGEASAYPHGSGKPQQVREGEVVLMDCGASVHGYESDISRSFVYGEPSREQRRVWNLVRRGQQRVFEAAANGVPAGTLDDAARDFYTAEGFGPDYALPGLSHRTGHGIGMDGHEPVYIVRGNDTALAPGMCFSNEPGLYLPGKFGIRLEDCMYMAADGPRWFSVPPPSIDQPFG